jgi:hypothetical protein
MSTTPPEQEPTTPDPAPAVGPYQGLGSTSGAILPIPGNAELALYVIVELVFAIVWMASDAVNAAMFCTLTAAITFAYFISRGIAKASRVLEQ